MKTCKYIDNILIFFEDKISPCYSGNSDKAPYYALQLNFGQETNIDFRTKYRQIIDELSSKKIEQYPCNYCYHLFETEELKNKYNLIIIKDWENKPFKYDINLIINNLYEKDLIDKENLVVEFQCGDIRWTRKFSNLISFFNDKGIKKFRFLTNNIAHDSLIENLLSLKKCEIYVTYNFKFIKDRKQQHSMVQILRRYMDFAVDKNALNVYYNLTPNYNDNNTDIEQFIKLIYRAGINYLSIRLNSKELIEWLNEDIPLQNCPKKFDKAILYFFKLAKKYSFYSDMTYEEQNTVLKKIFKTNKKISLCEKIKRLFRKKDEI